MARPRKSAVVGTVANLEALLATLRTNGVREYSTPELTIVFSERAALRNPMIEDAPPAATTQTQEQSDEDLLFYSAN